MTFYANDVHPVPPDHGAGDCDDQLPLISRVGRGIAGDDARVRIVDPDTDCETHLEGGYWDNRDNTWHSDWISENINGGKLEYQYNLRPYTVPRTFTITFIYRRPGRPEWSWTTPAIPYIWTIDEDGNKPGDDPDHIVGSGVATLFIRTAHDSEWNERLKYPDGTTRDDFNAPLPDEAWAATITFGKGGDVEVPDFDDIAKIIGVSKQDIYDILEDKSVTINGIDARNLIDYIDKCDKRDRDHFHSDLGFNTEGHRPDTFGPHPLTKASYTSVKAYIDAGDSYLNGLINDPSTGINVKINNLYQLFEQLVSAIYGVSLSDDAAATPTPVSTPKKITVDNGDNWKIPTANINVLSSTRSHAILSHNGDDSEERSKTGDLKAR